MKLDHSVSHFYIYEDEEFGIEYDFTNSLASGETLSSCTIAMYNEDGTDVSSSTISNKSISSPDCTFTISNCTAGNTYEIKLSGTSSSSNIYIGRITCECFGSITLNAKLGDPDANSYVTIEEANSYIRNARGHTDTWDTLSVEGKKRLLIEAAREIDKFNFIGEKYYDFQALQFPRDDHDTLTGDVATPITNTSFKNTSFTSDTYGAKRNNTNYWKYGSIHITAATPLGDTRLISGSNTTTDVVTISEAFTATPTTNTDFIAFEPLDTEIKNAQCEQALFILDSIGNETVTSYGSYAKSVRIGDVTVNFKDGVAGSRSSVSNKSKILLSKWIKRHRRVYRG